jgi:predicted permease
MLADLRAAGRALRRAPGYLAAAVLTLALGIGATTALFGVVDAVLLKPLPYRDPGRLVSVWDRAVADGLYDALRTRSHAYAALAGYGSGGDVTVLAAGPAGQPAPARAAAAVVTGTLFETLGVGAALGRALGPADARLDAPRVAVVSDAFWRERLGGDPRAVGRSVTVDGVRHEVVGVMPPAFRLPSPQVALWTPKRVNPADQGDYWWNWRMALVGRLAPGVTPERAQAETRAVVARAGREYPTPMNADFGLDLRVVPMRDALVAPARTTLYLLLGAVAAVLVVAVVNTTGLTFVRAAGREREVTVRAAVGASRARLVRQLVAEGVVVAGLAGALGAALAWALTRAIVAVLPRAGGGLVPRADEIGLDLRALAFAFAAALVAGVASALAPALGAARLNVARALAAGGTRGTSAGVGGRRTLEGLVVTQVALGVVLASGAALLATSLVRLRAVDPGFRAEQVTVAEVPPPVLVADVPTPGGPGTGGARTRAFYDALLARVRAMPGVQSAGLASAVPFGGMGVNGVFDVEAHPRPANGEWKTVTYISLTPGTLRTLGVPLVAGRDVGDADRAGGPLVAVVDSAAVRRYWPEFARPALAIGQRVRRPGNDQPWITIVGVAGSVRVDSLSGRPNPTIYLPAAQDYPGELRVVVRTTPGGGQFAPALRRAVREIDPSVPVGAVRPLAGLVDDSAARPRFVAGALAAFALAAVLLGAVGVYGVVAFAVARRTREVGVRVALGATPAAVRGLVLRDGARLAAAGVAAGLVGALAGGRLVRGLLYGVSAAEPGVLAGVAVLLSAVVLLASLLPALRAARVSPLVAMRAE